MCSVKKRVLIKFRKFHRKTLVLESVLKKRLQHRCFPVKHAKFLITAILKNICEQLLLKFRIKTSSFFWDLFFRTVILYRTSLNSNRCYHPSNIYLFKFSDRNTRERCSNMFRVNCKNTRTTSLSLLLNIYSTPFSSVFIDDFEQVNVCWAEAAIYMCVIE